jgi:thymidylate kinase
MAKHPFIVLEGLDGCGKSTLAKELARRMGGVVFHTPPCDMAAIRQTVDKDGDPLSAFFYYMAGNFHASVRIRDLLALAPVICDRYYYTTLTAHQGAVRRMGLELFPWKEVLLQPDYIFHLEVSEDVRRARLMGRGNLTDDDRSSVIPEISAKNLSYYRAMGATMIDTEGANAEEMATKVLSLIGWVASPLRNPVAGGVTVHPAESVRLTLELELESCQRDGPILNPNCEALRDRLTREFPEVYSIHGEPSIERLGLEVVFGWSGPERMKTMLSLLSDEGFGTSFRTALHAHVDCSEMSLPQVVGMGIAHPNGMTSLEGLRVTACSLPWNAAIQEEFQTILSMVVGDPDGGRERVWNFMRRHSSYKKVTEDSFYSAAWGKNSAVNLNPWLLRWFGLPRKKSGGGYGSVEFRAGFAASKDGSVAPLDDSTAAAVGAAVEWVSKVVQTARLSGAKSTA